MPSDEEILIPIPKINPLTINNYINTYLTNQNVILGGVAYEIGDTSAGLKGFVPIPFAATIVAYSLLADASGDMVVDIWKDTMANFPPDNSDSITAGLEPELSSAQGIYSTTLTGWTTSVAAGDVLAFNVDSCSGISKATITLFMARVIS